MKKQLSIFLLCFSTLLCAQKSSFNKEITKVKGDLNNDDLIDYVQVLQDTLSDTYPYKLEVYFAEKNGAFKRILSSTKAIDPAFPEGKEGYRTGNAFDKITIKKGILTISNGLLRGNFKHKFRFQNGNFELIGFSHVYYDGHGKVETDDFNLSTGIRIEKTEPLVENDFPTKTTKKNIIIKPLPKLQDFVPFNTEYY